MNKNERITFEKYKKKGITLNWKGWPDFYYFLDGRLTALEVKAPGDDLTFEQQAVRDFLIAHGVRYIVELVKDGKSVTVFDSSTHADHSTPPQPSPFQSRPAQTTPPHPTPAQPRPPRPKPGPSTPSHPTPRQPTPFQAKPCQANSKTR